MTAARSDWGRRVEGVLGVAASAILLVMMLLTFLDVVLRYVFNRPPAWVDDAVGFVLVGVVMLAAAQVLRRGEHIGVDLLTSRLSPRARVWAEAWSALAVLAAALVLLVNGWSTALFSRSLGIVAEGNVEIPVFWVQLFLPAGGALMALVALESLARLAAGAPPAEARHEVAERPE